MSEIGRGALIVAAMVVTGLGSGNRAEAQTPAVPSATEANAPQQCLSWQDMSASDRRLTQSLLEPQGWQVGQPLPCVFNGPGHGVGGGLSICVAGVQPNTQECVGVLGAVPGGMQNTFNSVIQFASPSSMTSDTRIDASSGIAGTMILLKDNIETRDMPTTAGSLAMVDNAPGRDAPLVARLRKAGAVILGKTNLSEWANIRSSNSISGWSAVGGQTRNPYDGERTPCGSSSGSAVAVAIGLAPVAIGTETNGSIVCPASVNGVVGFKPTVGLVSRTHVVPNSHSQDTAGPIATTVEDAAIVLSVIAGSDPMDAATVEADARKVDYRAALDAGSLGGARIGVMRFLIENYSEDTKAAFERSLVAMREAGAELVEITEGPDMRTIGRRSFDVLMYELKADLNAYLATTDPEQVKTRTLADLIAFNEAEPRETELFGQELFIQAQAKGDLTDPDYIEARETSFRLAGPEGIDKMMRDNDVVALVAPTTSRGWTNDREDEDNAQGSSSTMAAVAGYPHLTVPMGMDRGMPVGISFIGGKWDDARILSLGHAFEKKTMARVPPTL